MPITSVYYVEYIIFLRVKSKGLLKRSDYFKFVEDDRKSATLRLVHIDVFICALQNTDILSPRHSLAITQTKSVSHEEQFPNGAHMGKGLGFFNTQEDF